VDHLFRQASRLLVLTPEDRVLLLRLEPSFRDPFWVTPGGGLDDGESFEDAAARELREEVGRDNLPIGPCVWRRSVVFTWEQWRIHQEERTFVVPVAEAFDAVTVFPDEEPITGSRWFGVDELRLEPETVYPLGLAEHLERLLTDGPAAEPIHLGCVVED
jgi:8-oxo-dGTP pyrophosphatase MutT (NUDIX family)